MKHTPTTGPAPALQSPGGLGPLQGLRVIELASIGPGPMCCMLLADQGADVVRVDRLQPSGLGLDQERRFDVNSRGRRSVALDLKTPAGRDAVLRLVDSADVLIEGFRPGVTESLGLGPADCHARNPRLVYGRMTGFGQTGPLAQAAGHDMNYIALTGALHAIGAAGGPPVPPLNVVGDYGGGALYLAFGVMAALYERQRSGRGQVVDAAMVDGAASLSSVFFGLHAAGNWGPERGSNLLDGGAPFYSVYETADGKHISLGPLEPKFFATLWPEMRAAITAAVKQHTRDQWCEKLEGSDACFAPVLAFDEAPQHAHALARGAFVTVEGVQQPAPAPRFSRTPAAHPRGAPRSGEHTAELLQAAGYSVAEVTALQAAGVAL